MGAAWKGGTLNRQRLAKPLKFLGGSKADIRIPMASTLFAIRY
jgi:hypothetical protein